MKKINSEIFIIVAMTKSRVIGNGNKIPWHVPEDMATFKRLTTDNVVIMGRKTYESIGRVLPNRFNIIISSNLRHIDGAEVYTNLTDGINRAKQLNKKIFCIGGKEIYKEALSFAQYMYISWINGNYKGDIKFPTYNKEKWMLKKQKNYGEFNLELYKKNSRISVREIKDIRKAI